MFIPDPDPDFLPIPGPGSRGQKGTASGSATLPYFKVFLFFLNHDRATSDRVQVPLCRVEDGAAVPAPASDIAASAAAPAAERRRPTSMQAAATAPRRRCQARRTAMTSPAGINGKSDGGPVGPARARGPSLRRGPVCWAEQPGLARDAR